MIAQRRLVVIGNGMVGHRFIEEAVARGLHQSWHITVLGEEPRAAYDRVNLSTFFAGKSADDLSLLPSRDYYHQHAIACHLGDKAAAIDRASRIITTAGGRTVLYDRLVLATGSFPFVPPVPGRDAAGCFVYRTLDDLEAIRAWATGRTAAGEARKVGVVVGGGLLGLECANAVKNLGLVTNVVDVAPRLMGIQVDDGGGALLRRKIEALGVKVHLAIAGPDIHATESDGDLYAAIDKVSDKLASQLRKRKTKRVDKRRNAARKEARI